MKTMFLLEFYSNHEEKIWQSGQLILKKDCGEVEKAIVHYCKDLYNVHHVCVRELPVGELYSEEEWITQRIYLPDGTLWHENTYSTIHGTEGYDGRDESELHFKVGGKVEVILGNTLVEGIVFGLPPKKGEFMKDALDYLDDSYTVLIGKPDWKGEKLSDEEYMKYHEHILLSETFSPKN